MLLDPTQPFLLRDIRDFREGVFEFYTGTLPHLCQRGTFFRLAADWPAFAQGKVDPPFLAGNYSPKVSDVLNPFWPEE